MWSIGRKASVPCAVNLTESKRARVMYADGHTETSIYLTDQIDRAGMINQYE